MRSSNKSLNRCSRLAPLHGLLFIALLISCTEHAFAHASEQAFVLLLPTNIYITSGVLAVALTVILLALLPGSWCHRLFANKTLRRIKTRSDVSVGHIPISSIVSTVILFLLLWLGLYGSHDPLENPLPLFIWTLWWIGFVVLQGIVGDLWKWVNPWTGVYRIIRRMGLQRPPFQLPENIGAWPGVIGLMLFMLFALADIAPDSPSRLTIIVGLYWLFTLLCLCLFGLRWLNHGECFTMLLQRYSQLAFIGRLDDSTRIGFPGWLALAKPAVSISSAVFILVLLGTGSFDGFNETFYWLSLIGVNPLEFPGRSAVIMQTTLGLFLANALLIGVYAICVYIGFKWAHRQPGSIRDVSFRQVFCHMAIAILPIAFAYHFAHFLTAFLVNAQYAIAAASDPLDMGADLLGLGTFYVTTGFMNSHHTVEAIWLTQAAAVVLGHVLSVILAHALALDLFGSARRAIISQVPLAAFMVGYTFIGLWLLAAPRGA